MFCIKCGIELSDGTVFCTSCGAKQESPVVKTENKQENTKKSFKFPINRGLSKGGTKSTTTPDKKKRRKIIGTSVAGVAVVALVAGAVVLNQPKIKLMRSAHKTYQDIVKTKSGLSEYLGLSDIIEEIMTGKTHQELTLSGKLDGERIGGRAVLNMDKKRGETGISVYPMYKDSELLEVLLYQNKERTVLASPELYDGTFYINNQDAVKKFSDSSLNTFIKDQLGFSINKDDFDMDTYEKTNINELMNRFMNQSAGTFKQLGQNMTVEKMGKKNFTIGGKSKKCTEYEVTVSKKDIKNLLKEVVKFAEKDPSIKQQFLSLFLPQLLSTYLSRSMWGYNEDISFMQYQDEMFVSIIDELDDAMTELADSMEEDLSFKVCTGPKGRLVSLEWEYEFAFDSYEESLVLNVALLGTGNPLESIEAEAEFARSHAESTYRYMHTLVREQTYNKASGQMDDTGELTMKRNVNRTDGSSYMYSDKLSYNSNFNKKSGVWELSLKASDVDGDFVGLKADGMIEDIKKGKSFTFVMDKLKLEDSYGGGDYMPTFEGQYLVGSLGKASVNVIPEELSDEIDLFDMGISEIKKVGESVAEKLINKVAKAGIERLANDLLWGGSSTEATTAAPTAAPSIEADTTTASDSY